MIVNLFAVRFVGLTQLIFASASQTPCRSLTGSGRSVFDSDERTIPKSQYHHRGIAGRIGRHRQSLTIASIFPTHIL
jgi:hypothetical protein